jgi:hypothetical protein
MGELRAPVNRRLCLWEETGLVVIIEGAGRLADPDGRG